jgi:hypothetical protein
MEECTNLTGKMFRGKFFIDQHAFEHVSANISLLSGGIRVFEHTKGLKDLNLACSPDCRKFVGKKCRGNSFENQFAFERVSANFHLPQATSRCSSTLNNSGSSTLTIPITSMVRSVAETSL